MSFGKAFKIRCLKKNWHTGTALYRVGPPVEVVDDGFLTDTEYVIVAETPRTADTNKPETTIFAAKKNGSLFRPNDDNNTNELEESGVNHLGVYLRGKRDHAAALAMLGYDITDNEQEVIDCLEAFRAKLAQLS